MYIRNIIFDLDDTLYNQLSPFEQAFFSIFPKLVDLPIHEIFKRSRKYSDELWTTYQQGELTLLDLRIHRLQMAMRDFDLPCSTEEATQFQADYDHAQNSIYPFDGVEETLSLLQMRGFQLGIITNGPVDHQLNKILRLQLGKYMDSKFILVSDDSRFAKPDPQIFSEYCRRHQLLASECLYIGDSWRNDVVPALHAGWQSIWYNYRKRAPLTQDSPLTSVFSWRELAAFLNELTLHKG